jgi:ATP-binding cassette, subfamily C (CFTR/MRP), member 1
MGARQRMWLEAIQKRVKVTSDMLGSMKEVRMSGLQSRIKAELQSLRSQEIESSRGFKNALALIVTICKFFPIIGTRNVQFD